MMVNSVRLTPDPSGALWWPEARTMIVADLHLEKGSAFARRGVLLPPYDSRATLDKLDALVRRYAPRRLIALGDSFHDPDAADRLSADDLGRFKRISEKAQILWIAGNHDPVPPTAMLGGEVVEELTEGGLVFRHQAASVRVAGEVSGHYHPKASVTVRGRRLTRRCFVTDGARLVLPAFGAYAGGLDVRDAAFVPLFRHRFQAWILGDTQVFPVPSQRIYREPPDKD